MVKASHICTNCGYEGRPIRLPGDGAGEDEPLAVTVLNKLVFAATFIPFKFGWIVRLAKRGKARTCPNCGLPLMVKLNTDAGWVAKRKQEVRAGLVKFEAAKPKPASAFGKELPQAEAKAAPAKKPTQLPSLDEMLRDPEPELVKTEAEPPASPRKKPVDPDQW
jgi:hypothetical protein